MASLPVYVSLTTISSRLKTLPQVLASLLAQAPQPDKIILNISREPYMLDKGVAFQDFPEPVRELVASGRIELFRVANQGPYRKLLPTLRCYSGTDFLVATSDDDVIYPPGWLAGLVAAHERHRCIAAYRCRILAFGKTGLLHYDRWLIDRPKAAAEGAARAEPLKSLYLLPTGRGGVLYHSSYFRQWKLLDAFRQLAPGQDDLALRWATMVADIPVTIVDVAQAGGGSPDFDGLHNRENLYYLNRVQDDRLSVNDKTWNSLADYCVTHGIAVEMARRLTIQTD